MIANKFAPTPTASSTEATKHHVAIDQPQPRMAVGLGQGADDGEAELLPQRHDHRVGRHHAVELHDAETQLARHIRRRNVLPAGNKGTAGRAGVAAVLNATRTFLDMNRPLHRRQTQEC